MWWGHWNQIQYTQKQSRKSEKTHTDDKIMKEKEGSFEEKFRLFVLLQFSQC